MIESIELVNYRCYEKTKVNLKDIAVIVGSNNAGKTSFVEALRLVSYSIQRSGHTSYYIVPSVYGVPTGQRGFRIQVDKLKVKLRGVVYHYKKTVAKIDTLFSDGTRVCIYADDDDAYAVIFDKNGNNIRTNMQARQRIKSSVAILPQIGLIRDRERMLSTNTVRAERDTYLSSLHFRNEVYLFRNQYWDDFSSLVEETWKGIQIREILHHREDDHISLIVRDRDFSAEIGMMGSGLQMWMQIIWFICRTREDEVVILDEPDVYMHPELQSKLLAIIRARYKQIIIATHSSRITSEVNPKSILMIDRKTRKLTYAKSQKEVQEKTGIIVQPITK